MVQDLIGAFYDAASDELPWDAVVERLRVGFGAKSAILHRVDLASRQYEVLGWAQLSHDVMAPYLQHFYAEDLWTLAVARLPRGQAYCGELLVPHRELVGTAFFNDFLRPNLGVADVIGGIPHGGSSLITPIGMHLAEGQERYGMPEVDGMQLLLPHLGRALAIHDRFARHARAASDAAAALDRLADGIVLCDRHARVIFANAAARAHGARGDGLVVDGRIGAVQAAVDGELKGLIALQPRPGQPAQALRLPRAGGGAFFLLVAPLAPGVRTGLGLRGAEILVLITSSDGAPMPPAARIARLFGLSVAEADIALALSAGERAEEIAERRGVRLSTVRTQLSAILAKTGTARQAELVRLIGALPRLQRD